MILRVLIITLFLFSCHPKPSEVSFYYWRVNYKLSLIEQDALRYFQVKQLYVRLFDIDKINEEIVPVGEIQFLDKIPSEILIHPVVYITNRSLKNLSKEQVQVLSKNIYTKIESILKGIHYTNIQLDCDWTDSTRQSYFQLLTDLKSLSNKKITSTIRLHQVKYPYQTKIPPIDSGVLMFYNMGNLENIQKSNSIYNSKDAQKYISYLKDYPIPLDIALPIFSWWIHLRDGKVLHLSAKTNGLDINRSQLRQIGVGHYQVETDFLEQSIYYRKGDTLKLEQISIQDLQDATKLLKEYSQKKSTNIIFYDLDEYNLNLYKLETLKKILTEYVEK